MMKLNRYMRLLFCKFKSSIKKTRCPVCGEHMQWFNCGGVKEWECPQCNYIKKEEEPLIV